MPSGHAHEYKFLQIGTLFRVWRTIQSDKDRVWIARDFGDSSTHKRYLVTLQKLGLIELVDCRYRWGKRHDLMKATRGYKLILEKKNES